MLVFGPLIYGLMPFVQMMPQPQPLYVTVGMAAAAFACTLMVCEAGKYLPKLDDAKSVENKIFFENEIQNYYNSTSNVSINPFSQ